MKSLEGLDKSADYEALRSYGAVGELQLAMQRNQATPLSLASADFDEDGIPDLVGGFDSDGRGFVSQWRGRERSVRQIPRQTKTQAIEATVTEEAFFQPTVVLQFPTKNDFVGAGDFDADGHADIVTGSYGGTVLYYLSGDGHGRFKQAQQRELSGTLRRLITGDLNRADGLMDLVVGVTESTGDRIVVFEGPNGAMNAQPETFKSPAPIIALTLGDLDHDQMRDIAVGLGSELLVIHGRDRKLSLGAKQRSSVKAASVEKRSLQAPLSALAAGEFTGDGKSDLAYINGRGDLWILGQPDNDAGRTSKLAKWKATIADTERWKSVSSLSVGRVGSGQQDSLIVLDGQRYRLSVLTKVTNRSKSSSEVIQTSAPDRPFTETTFADARSPQAVLFSRINGDALDDMVVVQQGKLAPAATISNPSAIITVNSSADTNVRDNVLTLREAILLANEDLLKSALTAAEQQQVQGTPAPGLDEVRFDIAAGNPPAEHVRNEEWQAKLGEFFSTPTKLEIAPLILSLSVSPLPLTPTFTGQTPYALPNTNNSHPHSVVAFERLGRPGLVVTNRASTQGQTGDSVTVFYATSSGGTFDGTFVDGVTYPLVAGAQPQRVVVGNLGQLNVPSLVVAASFANKVAVLLGKPSDDTFQPPVYYQTDPNPNLATFPESLTLGDFNSDGNLDIAVANYGPGSVGILLGNSNGTFQNVVTYPEVFNSAPEFIVTADFNGDGKLDLATCNSGNPVGNNKISVLFGNGDGTFQIPPALYTTGLNPIYMVTADFNGDGKSDLATTNAHGTISVLLNSGTGTFPTKTDPSAGTDPGVLAAADVNLDGFPDLVVASSGGNNVTVLLNNTDGTFKQPAISTTAVAGSSPIGVTTGDFNVDGKPDIAVANFGNNTLGVLLNTTVDVCGFSLNPTSQNIDFPGGSANVSVAANPGCSWSATSNANWIHSAASGNGNGTALYTVDQNLGAARSGTLAIGGHLLTINQASGCSFSINPTVKNAVAGPDNGFVTVTSSGGDCPWTATSNVAWIQIAGASQGVLSGIGNGVVNYNVAPNIGPARTGTLTIAGQIFTVLQNPGGVCSYSISPISQGFGPGSGSGQFGITAPFGCNWTATSNNTSFVTITSGATGSGNGTVNYSVGANVSGSPRSGTITVTGGNMFTVIQGTNNTNLRSITLTSPLPQITDPIIIDGWTQGGVGYSGPPLIEINGQNLAAQSGLLTRDGLRITAGSSLIRGLVLNRFTSATRDAAIRLTTNGNNVIEGCYLGPDANGTNAFVPANTNGLASGITIQSSSDNLIGGLTAAKRNLISGIDGTGISVSNGATRNLVQGNYIGVDVTGSVRLTDGSGNAYQRIGVYIQNAGGNTVGGTSAGAGNLISGNLDYGVFVQDESTNNLVQGNFIGTNALGAAAVPNSNAGVFLYRPTGTATSADNTIGGTTPSARNVISGNEPYGVVVGSRATGSLVQGNYIGTNTSGTLAVANTYGVTVTQATGSSVGGDPLLAPSARNVISGNRLTGIYLGFLNNGVAGGTGVVVLGNYIGTDASGDSPLGNSRDGVFVEVQSASDTIQSNRVAYNGDNGIRIPNVSDVPGTPGVKIQIVDNLIYANTSLGIDLGEAGVTPNDPLDADVGANLQQNFPELTSFGNLSVSTIGDKLVRQPNSATASIVVSGTLRSSPNSTFTVHWYFSNASQCAANQQPSQPLQFGKIPNVSTDSNGIGPFKIDPFDFPTGTTSGVINCTATDSVGNTSEFSACLSVAAPTPTPTPTPSPSPSPSPTPTPTVVQTPTGQNVVVTLNGITVTFANVTGAGTTTSIPINLSTIGQVPNNYQLTGNSVAFDISTTAVVQPPITVCFNVQAVADANVFGQLRILHKENGSLVDRTSSQDFATKMICTSVNSLSPFVLASTSVPLWQLLLEETGAPNHAAGLDSITFLRDPFPVINQTNLNLGPDRNTRVLVFVRNLQLAPNETAAAVVVNLVDSNNQSYDIAAENVWFYSDVQFSHISFRLPGTLAPGACTIQIKVHGQISNSGFIHIKP